MTVPQKISWLFLFLFPLFEAGCYIHLHWKRDDLMIRKRNKSAIYVASLAGWLAYFNLVVSIFGGVPCWAVYVASLLVAPLSIGPQIIRALSLRGTIRYSQLVIEDEISSRSQRKKGQLATIPSESSDHGQSLPALVAASEKKIEADLVMEKTKRVVKMTKVALIVVPIVVIVLAVGLSSDKSQLLAADFGQCYPEPASFQYSNPVFGVILIVLSLVVTILVKEIGDELHIGEEIRRNSIVLGFTYIIIIVMRFLGYYELQPIMKTIQQMMLSFSMAIFPFLPQSALNSVASWAKQQTSRINPATKSAVPGYARPLPKGRTSVRTSTRNSIQNVMGRRQSLSAMQNGNRDREMTVSWDAGLCILLSTEDGINLFSQHCAREFSSENVRFWCAVNDYKAKFDEENCVPNSTEVDDAEKNEKSAPATQTNDDGLGLTMANEIYRYFISHHSKTQVNISSKQRSDIKKAIDSGQLKRETFDPAQREIFSVMSRDSYPRFLQSKQNRAAI